jgi:hypothetical protein
MITRIDWNNNKIEAKKKIAIYANNKIKTQFVLIQLELNRKRTMWYYLRKILNHKIMKSLQFIYLFYFGK